MTKEEKVDLLKQELEQEIEEEKQPEINELVNPLWIEDPDLSKYDQNYSYLWKVMKSLVWNIQRPRLFQNNPCFIWNIQCHRAFRI